MPDHFTDKGDPASAFELDLARAPEHELRDLEAAQTKPDYDDGIGWIWRLSAQERIAHMRAGRFSLRQLAAWSARYPDEVPKLPHLGRMEFEWIVVTTPEWAEARDPRTTTARSGPDRVQSARAPGTPGSRHGRGE